MAGEREAQTAKPESPEMIIVRSLQREVERQSDEIERLRALLLDARHTIAYLHEEFRETDCSNQALALIDAELARHD